MNEKQNDIRRTLPNFFGWVVVLVLSVGNKLNISEVNEKYNGEYTCEVQAKERINPKSITHKLLVLQRPKISTSSILFIYWLRFEN